jgi:hypothetical protein
MRCIALLACACALSACVGPTVVVMKNPQSGEVIQCKGASTGLSVTAESFAARDCAAGYSAAGWQRMN